MDDRYGLALTTPCAAAHRSYLDGVDRMLALQPGVEPALRAAVHEDPGFALAHAALGRWLQMTGQGAAAREAFARADATLAGATPRERSHVGVFVQIAAGRPAGALQAVRAHLGAHPRDALVLSTAASVFGLIGLSGRPGREPEQLALLDGLAPHYADDGWFLSMHAFAHIETGRLDEGLAMAEASLARGPANAHAAHVLAHALYEFGEDARAGAFLRGWLADGPPDAPLRCHLWWHVALSELAAGRMDAAAAILAGEVLPSVSRSLPINTFTDGVSLLWRGSLAGMPTEPQHWHAVRDFGAQHWPRPGTFLDVHEALALAGCGDLAALEQRIDTLETAAAAGRLAAGPVVPAIARAAAAFVRGDDAQVAARLEPVLDEVVRIGGSRAQRDLIPLLLQAARVRCGAAGANDAAVLRPRPVPGETTPKADVEAETNPNTNPNTNTDASMTTSHEHAPAPILAAARTCFEMHRTRVRYRPLEAALRAAPLEDAYRIQDALHGLMSAAGRGAIAGWKIALTSAAMQRMTGVDQPAAGALFSTVLHTSPARLSVSDFHHLGVEFEVAVRIGADLGPGGAPWTRDSVAGCVAACMPAFELVEDGHADYGALDAFTLIAQNTWNGGVVLGEPVTGWRAVDLERAVTRCWINELPAGEGRTGDVMGHPLEAVAWLANLLNRRGRSLEAGVVVMTGSSITTRFPGAGDRIRFAIDGLGEVRLELGA